MIALLLLLALALPAWAQSIDAGSTGRAGAHDLSIKTGSVLNWNPAVLAQISTFRWSLELPSVAGSAANNAFSVAFWNKHLAGDQFFTSDDKNQILDRIPNEGLRVDAQGSVPIVGFTYNRFGFHATLESAGHATAPRDIIQLALWGNEVNRLYEVAKIDGDQQVFGDYSAGFGYKFDADWVRALYFGAGFHFYHGFFLEKIVRSEISLVTTDTTVTGFTSLHSVTSRTGDGVGFDLGTMIVVSNRLEAGLAFRQIGAQMTWDVSRNHQIAYYTDSTGVIADSLDEPGYLDRALHKTDTVYAGGAVETRLPMVIQANLRYALPSRWTMLGDLSVRAQESVKGPAGADGAVGVEYLPIPWLLLQGGVGGGNLWGLRVGIGGGLRFERYELDLGGTWNGGFGNSARGVGLGLTQRLKF